MADLAAARRREPAAVSRVDTAYAPGLFRFFVAAVADRHTDYRRQAHSRVDDVPDEPAQARPGGAGHR